MVKSPFSAILPGECAIIQQVLQAENHARIPLKIALPRLKIYFANES
jgi:hypothetical protein